MELDLTPAERAEVFGDFDPDSHAAEAERRWGDSAAFAQSARRTARYTKEDWQRIKSEAADISSRFAAAMDAGVAATSEQAMNLAEEHRQHISRWFYDCSLDLHRGLGELYVSDPRFTANFAPGVATYIQAAITANSTR
ncbi:TipAS antibiotic-recognition domain-containing protein [Nonomuraea sediminis]|uniref:TipAS antibiotic-recognition domain-containing protein n=1 Tax=Nonomuraea sediminis TaxID=2835864 RepID=UPI001BDDB7AE|nr:TipAS antibiotic-recognition domain-containing protein [Nonomuraea sediminis]